jgi:hypothetical protein
MGYSISWSGKMLVDSILMGFGSFNLVEEIIDPSDLGYPSCKRDSASRAVDLSGPRLCCLGCTDAYRGMIPVEGRPTGYLFNFQNERVVYTLRKAAG